MTTKLGGGVYAAIVTPFDSGERPDPGAFRAIVEYVVGCGIGGLVVAGTTGENHALAREEKESLWSAAAKWARGRCPVVAGTGATTVREALVLQKIAADCGCDAALALTPWFEKPSPEAILRYYSDLAEAAEIPLLLYHNPSRTGLDWPAEHVAEVARKLDGRVVGVKDSAHDPRRVRTIRDGAPEGFMIFSGWPHTRAEFEAAGADGVIDALAGALPAETVEAWEGNAGKRAYVERVYAHLNRSGNYIALLKHMMNAMDLPAGPARRPFDSADPREIAGAPELRFRGGAAEVRPAWGFRDDQAVHLIDRGLVDACAAAPEMAGLSSSVVYRAEADDYCYNHHPQITWFDGRFWLGWSAGFCNEDSPGQVVRVATSTDGVNWSGPEFVMPCPQDRLRWTMGGFWQHRGGLYLLAGRSTRTRYVDGEVAPGVLWENQWCELFRYAGGAWQPLGMIMEDFYPNEPPAPMPDGRWIVDGVSGRAHVVAYVGAGERPSDWRRVEIATRRDNYSLGGTKLTEPSWYLCDGRLRMLLRDDAGSRRLLLTESRDGESWSSPLPTDFPDAQSKFRCMNLSSGKVVVVSNPDRGALRRRFLAAAVSDDGGRSFARMHKLRFDPELKPRHPGMHKVRGFSYPGLVEHDGRLWVAFCPNKEDVEVLSVPVGAL